MSFIFDNYKNFLRIAIGPIVFIFIESLLVINGKEDLAKKLLGIGVGCVGLYLSYTIVSLRPRRK